MKKFDRLNELINKSKTLSEKFYQNIILNKITTINNLKKVPEEWKKIYYKGYARFKEIILPNPSISNKISYKNVITKRQTKREFNKSILTLNKISNLLYYSAGKKNKKISKTTNRFYPSAGARYPLEVYFISLKTQLPQSLYHYYLENNSLEEILPFKKVNFDDYFGQAWINNAACLIIITAIFKRTTAKYGDRGYNYVMIEAGHLGQNFYLNSTALGLNCCAIGGFIENKINKLLDIDGINESVIYALAIG